MRRMTRSGTALAGGLATVLILVLGFATPAHARQVSTGTMTCDFVDFGDYGEDIGDPYTWLHLKLEARATYEDDRDAQVRRWISFYYRLSIVEGYYPGPKGKNNVNVRIKEFDRLVYTLNSPDNRKYGVGYLVAPSGTVTTSLPAHDHRTKDLIEFVGIFDFNNAPDQRCTAWVKVPPG